MIIKSIRIGTISLAVVIAALGEYGFPELGQSLYDQWQAAPEVKDPADDGAEVAILSVEP